MAEFRSKYNLYVTSIELDERTIPVEFDMSRDEGSSYTTYDKELIKKLKEDTSGDFYLFKDDVEEEIKEVKEFEEGKEYSIQDEITNISDAKEFLRAMGIPFQQLSNKAAILKKADEMKITFPNLK